MISQRFARVLFASAIAATVIGSVGAVDIGGPRATLWAPSLSAGGASFRDSTIRMVVHPSSDGSRLRIRLSNLRGSVPLEIGQASIAIQNHDGEAAVGSMRTLTVSHAGRFTIPAGGEVWSDPLPMPVKAGRNLLVSLYLPGQSGATSWHSDAFDSTYLSPDGSGNHATETGASAYTATKTSWYVLAALDVASSGEGSVVAFGDSITDGYDTPRSAYARWPDFLARRLAAAHRSIGVVDAGIGGNRVLTDSPSANQGISAIKRFDHDALALPGVHTVIVMEGINDIGNHAGVDGSTLTADQLIGGYRELIGQAHASGLRIVGATMLPYKGAGYYSDAGEAIRQAANQWIRQSGQFDGVVDFDLAMRDPADPAVLRASYDSGDHLHPNAQGMQAIAEAVDLKLLQTRREARH
jgi:lysophospholipase L1-like esterase